MQTVPSIEPRLPSTASLVRAAMVFLSVTAVLAVSGPASANHIGNMEASLVSTNGLQVTLRFEMDLTGQCCGGAINWRTGDGATGSLGDGVSNGAYTGDATGNGTLSDGRLFTWVRTKPGPVVHDITYSYTAFGTYVVEWDDCCPQSVSSFTIALGVPTAPQGVAAAPGPEHGEASLSWTAPADGGASPVSGYRVYRAAGTAGSALHASLGNVLSFVDTGLSRDVTYRYAVSAVNGQGEGPRSAEVATTGAFVPTAPQNVVAAAGPAVGEITVSWEAPGDEGSASVLGYRVYEVSGAPSLLAEVGPGTFSHVDGGRGNGVSRTYAVTASNSVGESAFSNEAPAETFDVPGAPAGLLARAGPERGDISLTWSAPGDDGGTAITSYRLYHGPSADDLHLHGDLGADTTAHVESGLGDDTLRFYEVTAVNDAGESSPSPTAHATTFAAPPPEPLPTGRASTSAAWQGHYAYVFGGFGGDGQTSESLDEIARYEPSTNTWTVLTPRLPEARHGTSAVWTTEHVDPAAGTAGDGDDVGPAGCHPACSGGIGLIFGGDVVRNGFSASGCHPACTPGSEILRFDPVAETVEAAGAVLPSPRSGTSAVWVASSDGPSAASGDVGTAGCHPACFPGIAFIFGGRDAVDTNAAGCHPACSVGREILRYDPVADSVSYALGSLPTPRSGTSAVYDGVHAFIFGGEAPGGATGAHCEAACEPGREVLRFDPATETVTVMGATFPVPVTNTSAAFDGRYAYIFGGESDGARLDTIFRYDPLTDTIAEVGALPAGRSSTSTVWTGSAAYVFGGDDGDESIDDVVRFTPSAPQGVQASAGPGAGEVTVTWDAPAEEGLSAVTGYRIFRGSAPGTETRVAEVGVTPRTFVDTGLDPDTEYFYRVTAVSDVGESPQSLAVSAITFAPPSPPTNAVALVGRGIGEITVQWGAPEDDGGLPVTSYRVYRATGMEPFLLLAEVPATTTEHVDRDRALGTNYRYVITAVTDVDAGAASNEAVAPGTQPGFAPPAPPFQPPLRP